jgi:hypothetical protein
LILFLKRERKNLKVRPHPKKALQPNMREEKGSGMGWKREWIDCFCQLPNPGKRW